MKFQTSVTLVMLPSWNTRWIEHDGRKNQTICETVEK